MTTTTTRIGTFQMLWDCPVCGTKKLLGVDHRHCPNCGAPQEENLRYFPSKEDRVPTDFRGADPDWECQHCGTPNGSKAGFCGSCGAPRGNASNVYVRPSIDANASETGKQAAADWRARKDARRRELMGGAKSKPKQSAWKKTFVKLSAWIRRHPGWAVAIGIGFVALLAVILLAIFDRSVELQVTGHSWRRAIPVEQYKTLRESAWCNSKPSDARVYSRKSEVHHHDKVPDGEDCRTIPESCSKSCRNVDNGDGSFSEVCSERCTPERTECTTRYRSVPVYADKCYYEVDRWVVARESELGATNLEPTWPTEPSFKACSVTAIGCERLGTRYGTYTVHYVNTKNKNDQELFQCNFEENHWQSIPVGSRWTGEVGRLSGELECEKLVKENVK